MIASQIESMLGELPSNVDLVAVSKLQPSDSIREAYAAGQRDFGESRPQELKAKVEELSADCPDIRWHFIGHLQTNKLGMVLPYVCMVQSVDSVHLLKEICRANAGTGRVTDVLLEMHIASEDTKQGLCEEEILDILFDAGKYAGVRFCGLMGIATNSSDETVVEADFERIDSFMAYLVDLFPELDHFRTLSTGMSGDWRMAVRHGSTMVRIGTAIFGERQ